MNLFGEPELGTDYIIRRRKSGRSIRLYSGVCAYCNRKDSSNVDFILIINIVIEFVIINIIVN